jgi:hypothetical protein
VSEPRKSKVSQVGWVSWVCLRSSLELETLRVLVGFGRKTPQLLMIKKIIPKNKALRISLL